MGFKYTFKKLQGEIKENWNTPQNKAEVERMKQGAKQVAHGAKKITRGLLFDENKTTAVVIEEKTEKKSKKETN